MKTLDEIVEKIVEERISKIDSSSNKVIKALKKRISNLEVFLAKSTSKNMSFTVDEAPSVAKVVVRKGGPGRKSDKVKLGEWLSDFRATICFNQVEFAAEVTKHMSPEEMVSADITQVKPSHISRWERGSGELIPEECLKKIVAMHTLIFSGEEYANSTVAPCPDKRISSYVAPVTSSKPKKAKKSKLGGKRTCSKPAETEVAQLIVKCRSKHELTMAQVAKLTKINKSQLYQYNKGNIETANEEAMSALTKLHEDGEKDVYVLKNKIRPSGSKGRSLTKV
jgi:hypothetical protein